MDDFYRENILDHYRNPRNAGTLDGATHSHQENNPLCGDVIQIDLHVNEDNVIDEVAFKGRGCAISQASASMLTEMIKGKTVEEAKAVGKEEILEALGIQIGPTRLKCALLSLKVLKAGVYGLSEAEWDSDDDW
ncbi:MAG TPA: SUF system NifU family Fe-S cluster assembly protein, partial [Anaerolineae bacterium]|nr:SUF system NifU family Fe-S cluster assembly protein [Anaerolineae bacterium]MCB0180092.1 SUF system NifU family Fe-S cluster assembly protein [Anaerolineae bacterium]MCB9109184.1 SUF system NifU family Fe-S cluster assembly protein [Anaerolineales bacterium]HRV96655.1 SUF system NifU family Fe-S cluster assembly protein [Anaerolineae bacterium]